MRTICKCAVVITLLASAVTAEEPRSVQVRIHDLSSSTTEDLITPELSGVEFADNSVSEGETYDVSLAASSEVAGPCAAPCECEACKAKRNALKKAVAGAMRRCSLTTNSTTSATRPIATTIWARI